MAVTPRNAYEETFMRTYDLTPAQKRSRLFECCMPAEEFLSGNTFNYNRIGQISSQEKVGSYAATPVNPAPHDRRIGFRDVRHANVPIDTSDVRRMISDPESQYVRRVRQEHGQTIDDKIIEALGGNAMRKDADSAIQNIALPAAQKIAHGNSGFTLAKIVSAGMKLDEAEVGTIDENPRYLVLSARQIADALQIEQFTSKDYTGRMEALMRGEIINYAGFMWKRSERLPKNGNVRSIYAFTKDAIALGCDGELRDLIIERVQAHSYARAVYAEWERGALRTAEERVVEIACQE